MRDSAIYDDLITSLIALKVILENIGKISIVIDLDINNKIEQLEAEKTDEIELLEEELRIITLRNKFVRRPNKIECSSIEGEIDLRRQTKKKIDNIEKLKEEVKEWEFKSVKILQDLNRVKNDEIVETEKIELKLQRLGASKQSINFLKKSIIPKKHLHLVLQARKLQYVEVLKFIIGFIIGFIVGFIIEFINIFI